MVKTEVQAGIYVTIVGNTHEGTLQLGVRKTMLRLIKIPSNAKVHAPLPASDGIWMLDVNGVQVPFHYTEFELA